MEQYINKSAVVAEIERIKANIKEYCVREGHDRRFDVVPEQLAQILSFIDSLETKEVDLEQEIKDILNQYYYFPEEAIDIPTIIRITAHHFFELGLKTQKGE